MLGTTRCPYCDASFNINEAHLDTEQGLVRCGKCSKIFDFRINYVASQPDPQLVLPISDDSSADEDPYAEDRIRKALAAARHREIFGYNDSSESYKDDHDKELEYALTNDTHEIETLVPIEFEGVQTLPPIEDDSTTEMEEFQEVEYEFAKRSYRVWPWAIGSCLTLITLALQAAYFFRVDLAARIPAVKPALVSTCNLLNCSVTLPQNASLMNIESSDLTDAQNHVVFNALLRNHATYTQAFPDLEFTLTDTHDSPLARRVFKPIDYLPPTENEAIGLLPNHEINIKLHLDTADIKPSGYRLSLFYPQ